MANRYWIGPAGGDNLWSNINNWSLTDGGGTVAAIPTNADDVFFTGTTNNACTLNTAVNKVAKSLTINGYTNTLTFNVNLSVSGSITFTTTGFTLAGTGLLRMIAAGTWTTNGKTIAVPVEIGGTTTFTSTLAGALTVSADITLTNTTSTIFSGAFDITCSGASNGIAISGTQTVTLTGNLISTGGGNAQIRISDANVINGAFELRCGSLTVAGALTGTATVRFTGSAVVSSVWSGAAACSCSVIIDGNVLLSGTVLFAASGTPTLTYTSGTITGGSTPILSVASACTIVGGTYTGIQLSITAALTLTLNTTVPTFDIVNFPNAAVTLAGTAGLRAGTWQNTAIASSAKTYTLTQGNTYTCTSAMNLTGATAALTLTLISSHASNKTTFIVGVGASQDIGFLNPTRLDSTGGQTCFSYHGTATTCFNWLTTYPVNANVQPPTFLIGA